VAPFDLVGNACVIAVVLRDRGDLARRFPNDLAGVVRFNSVRLFCVTAFASIAPNMTMAGGARAADMAAVGTASSAAATSTLPSGVVATVNGVSIEQTQLDEAVRLSREPDTPQLRQVLKVQLIGARCARRCEFVRLESAARKFPAANLQRAIL
jgi:hypothetical protein